MRKENGMNGQAKKRGNRVVKERNQCSKAAAVCLHDISERGKQRRRWIYTCIAAYKLNQGEFLKKSQMNKTP